MRVAVLATFVIGLREGLEAALIVGIIAAFLRRNGRSVVPMWCGVAVAVVLSAGVGIVLKVIESSLDQATQEGMETVIGAVAVFFVTSMVVWMSTNARGLKGELEGAARDALADGTSRALVVMAFLAVLKEGFETAVFLLATFQAAGDVASAATGAILGVLVAIVLGYALYRGGVRINLAKFFKATGVFLVLVAAGLVVSALRTAHEAGWLNIGQQKTLDLSWLAPNGSIRSALLTGVLGIPAQPRLIEVIGWFAYVIPVGLYLYLPARLRPAPAKARRLMLAGAAACAVAAVTLFLGVRQPDVTLPASAPIEPTGTIRLEGTTLHTPHGTVALRSSGPNSLDGVSVDTLAASSDDDAAGRPNHLTAEELTVLGGGRMPVGIDARKAPGPYEASWSSTTSTSVSVWKSHLVAGSSNRRDVLTVRGGGLGAPRTFRVADGATLTGKSETAAGTWTVKPSHTSDALRQIKRAEANRSNGELWGHTVPLLLLLTSAALLLAAWRRRTTVSASSAEHTTMAGATAVSHTRTNAHANH